MNLSLYAFASTFALLGTHSLTDAAIPTKCPKPEQLQTDTVKKSFDESKMEGFWYELAMKDATQPRVCKCQTSQKIVSLIEREIRDDFTIECYGNVYHNDLRFNLTDVPGVSVGTWKLPVVDRIRFPNTVVDYGENADGTYDWMIEFQCVQAPDWTGERIAFYAFNFYSRTYADADERIPVMESRARARGLGPFIDEGRDLAIVEHSGCLYGH
mmetsp:Transcript_9992/g.22268  ORF Transcript_9992/g.22268 Transcript_9992/m.22268 type:complete len:213 (-) Transcript_9992:413-1051(-)